MKRIITFVCVHDVYKIQGSKIIPVVVVKRTLLRLQFVMYLTLFTLLTLHST
jgi:hypothetical protein